MKKILIIFAVLIGLYMIFTKFIDFSWLLFGKHTSRAEVTNDIDVIEIDVAVVNTTIIPMNQDEQSKEHMVQENIRSIYRFQAAAFLFTKICKVPGTIQFLDGAWHLTPF
jgi:hypothetical protein